MPVRWNLIFYTDTCAIYNFFNKITTLRLFSYTCTWTGKEIVIKAMPVDGT